MAKVENFWFQKTRLGYRPKTWQGWLVSLIYVLALANGFLKAGRNSHSASDTLIAFAPSFIIASGLYWFICRRTNRQIIK